jgi:acetyl esterase/lipase
MKQNPLLAQSADPLVLELWPGAVPGDAGIEGSERSRSYESELVGSTRLITNVTRPSLTVYRPPADQNTGTAMLICPGGGYHDLFWELEGEEVAGWLNSWGMAGIILKYRCPHHPGEVKGVPPLGPLLDAQRAVSVVRSRAAEWGIDPDRIGMVGFSAGGHLALATATSFPERRCPPIDAIDAVSCRPDFAVLCYSGYLKADARDEIAVGIQLPVDTPPIFLAHASDDRISGVGHSAVMYLALHRAGVSPNCTSTPPASMTSGCAATRSCLPVGRSSASTGCAAGSCSRRPRAKCHCYSVEGNGGRNVTGASR